MNDRETFRAMVRQLQHEAEVALVRGDVGPRLEMWSHNDPVSLFAAVGPSKSGWDELEPTFRSLAARLSGGRDVDYEIMEFDMSGDMAWTAGFARFMVSTDGGPSLIARFGSRTSIVERATSGRSSTSTATSSQQIRPHPQPSDEASLSFGREFADVP